MEQGYENFQDGLKIVYFERFRHSASHRKEDALHPLPWIFPVLWVSNIILYSSCIYIISWKIQYTLYLLIYSSIEQNITMFKLPSQKLHLMPLTIFCPPATSFPISLQLLINMEHQKIHNSSISAQEMPSQNRQITPWFLHVMHLLIHPRIMFTLLITALGCWLTFGHVSTSFVPTKLFPSLCQPGFLFP